MTKARSDQSAGHDIMTRDFGRVFSAFWASPDMARLSEDARWLAVYLLTGPHTSLVGAFRLPEAYVMGDVRWPADRLRRAFGHLEAAGFARRCKVTEWIWIRKFLKWNPPPNPNCWRAADKLCASIPDSCVWRAEFLRVYTEVRDHRRFALQNGAKAVVEPFARANRFETVSKPFANKYKYKDKYKYKISSLENQGGDRGGAVRRHPAASHDAAPPTLKCLYDAAMRAFNHTHAIAKVFLQAKTCTVRDHVVTLTYADRRQRAAAIRYADKVAAEFGAQWAIHVH